MVQTLNIIVKEIVIVSSFPIISQNNSLTYKNHWCISHTFSLKIFIAHWTWSSSARTSKHAINWHKLSLFILKGIQARLKLRQCNDFSNIIRVVPEFKFCQHLHIACMLQLGKQVFQTSQKWQHKETGLSCFFF